MTIQTARLGLPLLSAAQAQKETTVNEALTRADAMIGATVVAVAPAAVPLSPAPGQCWIVGTAPSGNWAGHANAIAAWTEGGWRFVTPIEGMSVWSVADTMTARFSGSAWTLGIVTGAMFAVAGQKVVGGRQAHIVSPTGGTTVDGQARAAISATLAALEAHGLVSAT